MSAVLVAGLGAVGIRAARQLLDTPGVERVLVAARRIERAREVARGLHDGAEAIALEIMGPLPAGVVAVASALPGDADVVLARAAVEAGVPFASVADEGESLRSLSALDEAARSAGTQVVVGCGLAPGLADVLTRHAANALDVIDEIHVARWGSAGDACAAAVRRMHREPGVEWRDGRLLHDRHHDAELVWFPDPVGAREREVVATGIELLVAANPDVARATFRLGAPPPRRITLPSRRDPGAGWGAVRAEAWGWQGQSRTTIVYGVIERAAVAAGTTLGVTTAMLAGALPGVAKDPGPGAWGLAEVVEPLPFLAELARRGVKAAVFEGARVG